MKLKERLTKGWEGRDEWKGPKLKKSGWEGKDERESHPYWMYWMPAVVFLFAWLLLETLRAGLRSQGVDGLEEFLKWDRENN